LVPHGNGTFNSKGIMKRFGNLYPQICSIENLAIAEKKAMKFKSNQLGVMIHVRNRESNLTSLREMLLNKTFRTSEYKTFLIYEPKEREIFRLPFFPDRIVHHAVMNVLEPYFISTLTQFTYSCIKGRGIHAAARAVKSALRDVPGTTYCLKLDIKKFYPNVDHDILKQLIRRKFKDNDLLELLDEIIDSAPGLPIGNYLSQYLANFYLSYFDHWMKEVVNSKYYFRYADDIVILSGDKEWLHAVLKRIQCYLLSELKLTVKSNYQVFPVAARGIDFVGYVFYHTHTRLRKRIKQNFARAAKRGKNTLSIPSYIGWASHADTKNLLKKILA